MRSLELRMDTPGIGTPRRTHPWIVLVMLVAGSLGAQGEEPPAVEGGEDERPALEISGFVDGYYGYNFNAGSAFGFTAPLRNFDTEHDQLSLSLVEVALEQKPSAARRVGFRTDLDFGPTTDMVHAFEPGGADVFKNFEQAYVSYLAPLGFSTGGGGLQLDVGKFVTPHGAEVIEAKDNWNYSRSLLFALAIPYYHVGVRAALPVSDRVTLTGYLVNGWNNAEENNNGKTFGLSAAVKPSASLTIVQNLMTGPEQVDDDSRRFLSDSVVTWTATPRWSFIANLDYGRDQVAGETVSWKGAAAYARAQVTDGWALAPRLEWFRDEDGFMTGTAQTVRELTLTSEHRIAGGVLARVEYRRDVSDVDFFDRRGAKVGNQTTLTLGFVYAFASRL